MKKLLLVLVVTLFSTGIAFSQGTWTLINTSNSDIPSDRLVSLGMSAEDIVFIGTPGGLVSPSHAYEYDGTDWTELDWIGSFNDMKSSPAGHLAVATGEGVFHYDGVDHIVFNKDNSKLTANDVTSVDVGADGTEYVGLYAAGLVASGGLAIYDGIGWLIYNNSNSPIPVNKVFSVLKSNTSALWAGTSGGGLVKKDGDNWEVFDMDNSDIPGNTPTHMAEAEDGPLWVAFNNGSLATFDGSTWDIVKEAKGKDFPDAKVIDMLFDTEKNLWCGFENAGLGRFDGTNWVFYTSLNSHLPNNKVTGLELDSKGTIWVSLYDGGIAIYDPEYSSAVNSYLSDEDIDVYPNPVNSILNIEFKKISGTTELFVYDLMGKLVIHQEMNSSNHQLNCSELSQGLYTLKLKDQAQNLFISKPFVKR